MTNTDHAASMYKKGIMDVRTLTDRTKTLTALRDADTVLADLLLEDDFCPEDCQGVSMQLFSIFEMAESSAEQARLSELFSIFTGVSFGEYLKRTKAALKESLNAAYGAPKTDAT